MRLHLAAAPHRLGATPYSCLHRHWHNTRRRTQPWKTGLKVDYTPTEFVPVIGWIIATGTFSVEAWLMFALIFMWTPPHFWALALVKNNDYKAANIPMLPVVAGSLETRRQIVIYAVLLAPLAVVPSFIGMASVGYGVIAAIAGLVFVAMSLQLFKTGDHKHAMRLFAYSIMYLFLLFLGLVIDHAVLGYLVGAA